MRKTGILIRASLAFLTPLALSISPAYATNPANVTEGAPAAPSSTSGPVTVQPEPATAPTPTEYVYVAMTTPQDVITLSLDKTHAPITVANFLKYVDNKRFDGSTFYRAMRLDWGDKTVGLLQGGLQGMPGKIFAPIAHEPTNVTGLSHTAGAISMARYAPGTATADFTIMIEDLTALDAKPDSDTPDARAGFAAFGHVVGGMDVLKLLWNQPLSSTRGEGVMRGQMLEVPVKILTMRRTTAPLPALTPAPAPDAISTTVQNPAAMPTRNAPGS